MSRARAIVARRLVTLADERAGAAPDAGAARGEALFAPLSMYDKGLLVCAGGSVLYAGRYDVAHIPAGVVVEDAGDVTLAPAFVNAHTHLQLAHLAGRTRGGAGFAAWLASLIPLLREPLDVAAIADAVAAMTRAGTAYAADFTGHGAALVIEAVEAVETALAAGAGTAGAAQAAQSPLDAGPGYSAGRGPCCASDRGLDVTLCAEWFGFTNIFLGADALAHDFPPRVRAVRDAIPADVPLAPAGHALYSTRQEVLQKALAYCVSHDLPFAMHLAESEDETQLLVTGDGPLAELYRDTVLPPGWRAPGLPPVALAARLGLLGPHTLAVHGVQCTAQDAALLAATGTHVCLCPRSNAYIGVGAPPVAELIRAGVPLCLGTDGLSSNTDMDVAREAEWLVNRGLMPARAALRLLTRNGATALRRADAGALAKGMRAAWAVVPGALAEALAHD